MNDTDTLLPLIRLQFNINNPTIEECYLFGFECAERGLEESENPYPVESKENFYWQEGHWDAVYEEKPLFNYEFQKEDASLEASNDGLFSAKNGHLMMNFLKITGALAATIIVGYQVFELVA